MSDDDVRDTLIDCITSFVSHGGMAVAAADYILSDASGLSVYATDALAAAEQRADTLAAAIREAQHELARTLDGGERNPRWRSQAWALAKRVDAALSSRPVQPEADPDTLCQGCAHERRAHDSRGECRSRAHPWLADSRGRCDCVAFVPARPVQPEGKQR